MGEAPRPSTSSTTSYPSSSTPSPNRRTISLVQPTIKRRHKKVQVFRAFKSVFRSLPIITPACKFPSLHGGMIPTDGRTVSGKTYVTGTLFGYRKGRVSFSIQENPRTMPSFVIELGMHTSALQKEMSLGMVRVALECEKRSDKDKIKLLDEPLFTMFCNGKKSGYGVKREETEEDLQIMEVLKAVSMGAGVLPGKSETEGPDGEMAYMRAHFERVVGSRDSETFYMLSPSGGNNGPELSIFFVRI